MAKITSSTHFSFSHRLSTKCAFSHTDSLEQRYRRLISRIRGGKHAMLVEFTEAAAGAILAAGRGHQYSSIEDRDVNRAIELATR
jgi:hypothetical protein